MKSKQLLNVDRTIAMFALCLCGFGWGLMYLIVPLFGALILLLLAVKFLYKLWVWRASSATKLHVFSEFFRLMRNNPALPVRVEWIILLTSTVLTAVAMRFFVLAY